MHRYPRTCYEGVIGGGEVFILGYYEPLGFDSPRPSELEKASLVLQTLRKHEFDKLNHDHVDRKMQIVARGKHITVGGGF